MEGIIWGSATSRGFIILLMCHNTSNGYDNAVYGYDNAVYEHAVW
jgi:hypothetical protein